MENRLENGHRANFRPILEFGVPLGGLGLGDPEVISDIESV